MNVKELKKLLDEALDAITQKKGFEELLDSIAETAEEKLAISKADFKVRANAFYELTYNKEKYDAKREKVEGIYDDLDAVTNQ